MARTGRERWSNRLLVEDCLPFHIARLVRAGVFRAKPRTLCSSSWGNDGEQEILCAEYWWDGTASGRTFLHITYGVPSRVPLIHSGQSATIEIVRTQLHFGFRPCFLCPGILTDGVCRQRARILYFSPDLRRLGCRKCLNLIHRSAREHDARIDRLLRLPPEEFREVLASGTISQQLLAVRASTVLLQRLLKKTAKYAS